MTSKDIKALDYFVDFAVDHQTNYDWVVRGIAAAGKLRVDSLHPMLEEVLTPEHYLCRGHAQALLGRIAAMNELGLNMRDGALVMEEDKDRPPRTTLSSFEELVGKFMSSARRTSTGRLQDREPERLARLLDEAEEPLTKALRRRVRNWQEAVNPKNGVRHAVQKLISNAYGEYKKQHGLKKAPSVGQNGPSPLA
jgi:hypothetical protein